jgi:NADPH:quinone reductase-like Zn-dependent oxidoreductase
VEEEVKRLTDAKAGTVVFDAVGGPSFAKLVSSTSMDGLVLTYGVLSKQMNSFPAVQVFRRRLTIRGFTANTGLDDNARLDALKSYILPGLASGAFKPRSRRRFPSNASSTLTAISSQTNSSGKSSSPFSVLSGAVSRYIVRLSVLPRERRQARRRCDGCGLTA